MKTKEDISKLVINRIEDLCKKDVNNKLTPYQISKKGNFHPSTLNNFLSGTKKDLRISTLYKFCDGLEISIKEFFDDEMFQ